MSMSNQTENDILKAILVGTDPAWRASANSYVALFTADPTESGAFTNEATYTGYARVALTKASAWTDGGSTFTNANIIEFPLCTAGANTVTHYAICTLSTDGQIVTSGALNASLNISAGIKPQFSAGSLQVVAD